MLEGPGPRNRLRHLSCHCYIPFSAAASPESRYNASAHPQLTRPGLDSTELSFQSWSQPLLSSSQNITEKADQVRKQQAKQSSADTLLCKSKAVILQPLLSWALQHQAQLSPCFYFYFNNCLAAASARIAEELSSLTNQREKLACLPRVPGGDAAGGSPQTHLFTHSLTHPVARLWFLTCSSENYPNGAFSYLLEECSLVFWEEKRLFTLLVGDVPQTTHGCHTEMGLPYSPAERTRFNITSALYLSQSRVALRNFGGRGFLLGEMWFSLCAACEDGEAGRVFQRVGT